jgi:hypothetical protein
MNRREKVDRSILVNEGEGKQETRKVECRQDKVVIRWEEGDRRQEKGDADLKVPKREIFVTELY